MLAKTEPAHAAADLTQINVNDGFAELVKAVKPTVVNISVTRHVNTGGPGHRFDFYDQSPQLEEFFRRFFGEPNSRQPQKKYNQRPVERKTIAVGSGFVIDPAGLVVTNYHVIEDANEIEVVFDDGARIPATLKGTDKKTDLALLEIKTDSALPYVVFGDSDAAEVGDWVIAIGNPFGLGGTTTSGIISARGRDLRSGPLDDFIQIDASINRGNSGGPLFNTKGEVIGVNSAIYSPNGGSVGIGFAIPSAMVANVITQLRENGIVRRGYLGVHIQSITEEIAESLGLDDASGALVTQVIADSPAEKAGVKSGDVILVYDGTKITKMRDLPKLVALTTKDREVEIKLWRNDRAKTLRVAVGSNAEHQIASVLDGGDSSLGFGLKLAKVDKDKVEKYGLDEDTVGVVIVDVVPNSSAEQRGLREGDVIKRVDKTVVVNPADVAKAIELSQENKKGSVLLLVERNNQAHFVVIPMNT
ncbi:Do family serine endopeptidase [Candidatus Spongiihabitans sp.]|uniref:Do family serine endopeptidase n=1 Tax=Candidatus Spongiihabitans sp. TaxID=3101308 RepID=UPI003C7DA015